MTKKQSIPTDISRQILNTTVRIDTEKKDGTQWSGTGFIVDYDKDGKTYPLIVTNKHVVKDMIKGVLSFLKKVNGEPIIPSIQKIGITNIEASFTGHPDTEIDVAVMPLGGIQNELIQTGNDIFYITIPKTLFLKQEQIEELSAIEDIIFVGYPVTLRDESNLSPITRTGITATSIDRDFEGKPVFLIDASVFGGSSGSPVFILNQGSYATKRGLTMGSRLILLGIVAESHYFFEKGKMGVDEVKASKIPLGKQYIDIGVVFKSSTILETMECWASNNLH